MGKYIIFIAAALLSCVLLILADSFFQIPLAELASRHYISAADSNWNNFVNLTHNAYFSWRADPINSGISTIINYIHPAGIKANFYSAVFIFSIGLMCWLNYLDSSKRAPVIALSTALIVFEIIYLFGFDAAIIWGLSWLPFLLLGSAYASKSEHSLAIVIVVACLLSFVLNHSANQLTSFLILAAVILPLSVSQEAGSRKIVGIFALVIILATFAYQSFVPLPSVPAYPQFSRVVPDDGLAGNMTPLVGGFSSTPLINRLAVKSLFKCLAFVFFVFSILAVIKRKGSQYAEVTAKTAFVFALILFLDVCLPEALASISPLASISRVIPGLFYFPLAAYAMALTVIFLIAFVHLQGKTVWGALFLGVTFLFALVPCTSSHYKHSGLALLQSAGSHKAISELGTLLADSKISQEAYERIYTTLASPSYNVINKTGLWIIDRKSAFTTEKKIHPRKLNLSIETYPASSDEDIHKMIDRKIDSRWGSLKGKQEGNEYLTINLSEKININGINLKTGAYTTDFPRGLLIENSADCFLNEAPLKFEKLAEYPIWEGAVHYTADGFPYWSGQNDVSIIFSESVDVKCLKISQTGQTPDFDWSIAEIEFIK